MAETQSESGGSPTVLRMVLSKRLKELREKSGLSLDEAADALSTSALTVRRMENATTGLKIPYVQTLLRAYGASEQEVEQFVDMAKKAKQPGWWYNYRDVIPDWFTAYVSLETSATLLRLYEPHYATGLLQTPGYARAILRAGFPNDTEEQLDRRVELRLRRSPLLRSENAPTLWIVMEQAVLHRQVGGADVMREQIEALLEAAALPHVNLGIMPFSTGAHIGAFAPFTYFRFREPELPDIVYTDLLTGSTYFDQRPDVTAHLEAHSRMALQTWNTDTTKILDRMRKEYS